ncbi:MAG: hypothetical protein P1U44_03335 [Vicingaceae bacterium]|nr:hypothetical protein [Vicingaceae bacterium]
MLITFNEDYTEEILNSDKMPTIILGSAVFHSTDPNKVVRLSNMTLKIHYEAFDIKNQSLGNGSTYIHANVNSNTQESHFLYNNTPPIEMRLNNRLFNREFASRYVTTIELHNIELEENERIDVQFDFLYNTRYKLLCRGSLKAVIYITEESSGNPNYYKNVDLIKVNTIRDQERDAELNFKERFFYQYSQLDENERIVESVKLLQNIRCNTGEMQQIMS